MAAQTALKSKPTMQLPIQEALTIRKQRNFASMALKTSTMYPYKRKKDCKPHTVYFKLSLGHVQEFRESDW